MQDSLEKDEKIVGLIRELRELQRKVNGGYSDLPPTHPARCASRS